MESHLLQMRGLKRSFRENVKKDRMSHLLQMRGLKRAFYHILSNIGRSHLLQMRGLKLLNPEARKKAFVASFTDAWIETKSRF